MGRVHWLMIRACLRGICIGWALLALLILLDVMHLRQVIFASSDSVMAIGLLMVGFAITFGNASMGHAIMNIGKDKRPKKSV